MARRMIGLDFETYSSVDLPLHGIDRYLDTPDFQVLLVSMAYEIGSNIVTDTLDFNQLGQTAATQRLRDWIRGKKIAAHNAGFEYLVLKRIGINVPAPRFVDSAVVSRAAGGGSRLEAAAPQLLGFDKMEEGRDLIKLFSIPGKYQEQSGKSGFDPQVIADNPDKWLLFKQYCELDSRLSLELALEYEYFLTDMEHAFNAVTMRMNERGWPVDLPLVEEMQRRYLENMETEVEKFRDECQAPDLNLNSHKQLKEWCKARGVTARSFDEAHVASMLKRINAKLDTLPHSDPKHADYTDVRQLLLTKQVLGGSSLKKLVPLLNKTGADSRLRDQYLHCGAGGSLRTTGRGVQMQNLKRLNGEGDNVEELMDLFIEWNNTMMADNMRQLFCSQHKDGELIVGDFASVESRGLGWMAGAHWKTAAFKAGRDLYKVLAGKIYNVSYDNVTKDQRQAGKVAELGCGYGIGPVALKDFAAGMGVELSDGEATRLVMDWRDANPEVVAFWDKMQKMLDTAFNLSNSAWASVPLPDGCYVRMYPIPVPQSLQQQMQRDGRHGVSLRMELLDQRDEPVMKRHFHGCYRHGRNLRYYRASDNKTGDLWKDGYKHPKTKQFKHYELYGGKLTGILTQSLCREIFFRCLLNVDHWVSQVANVDLIGQFHDEIVLDWWTDDHSLNSVTRAAAKMKLDTLMSDPGVFVTFPLAAEVKSAYRYIK